MKYTMPITIYVSSLSYSEKRVTSIPAEYDVQSDVLSLPAICGPPLRLLSDQNFFFKYLPFFSLYRFYYDDTSTFHQLQDEISCSFAMADDDLQIFQHSHR
jgi:hypothetical protein